MTLVVMGLCVGPKNPQVIALCDRLLSGDFTSYEGGISKIQVADDTGRWLIGYSGDPDRFELLRAYFRHFLKGQNPDLAEVRIALGMAYAKLRTAAIEQEILKPAQIKDVQEFKDRGVQMGRDYYELSKQIRAFDLGIEAIIAGFGSRLPGLFSLAHPGRVKSHFVGSCGAQAIGSGCYHAQFHLDACYSQREGQDAAIYRILEAKMLADESVVSVGRATDLLLMETPGSLKRLSDSALESIRAIWEKRRKNVPELTESLDFVEVGLGGGPAVPQPGSVGSPGRAASG